MTLLHKVFKNSPNLDTCLPYLLIRVKLNKKRRSNLNQVKKNHNAKKSSHIFLLCVQGFKKVIVIFVNLHAWHYLYIYSIFSKLDSGLTLLEMVCLKDADYEAVREELPGHLKDSLDGARDEVSELAEGSREIKNKVS